MEVGEVKNIFKGMGINALVPMAMGMGLTWPLWHIIIQWTLANPNSLGLEPI